MLCRARHERLAGVPCPGDERDAVAGIPPNTDKSCHVDIEKSAFPDIVEILLVKRNRSDPGMIRPWYRRKFVHQVSAPRMYHVIMLLLTYLIGLQQSKCDICYRARQSRKTEG